MPQIELKGAYKAYGAKEQIFALRPTRLTIADGDFVAILGKSGSGKTTLLNLIAGLDDPTGGTVLVGGSDVSRMRESERARWRSATLGIVFQFYQLLPSITILDNLLLAMSLSARVPVGDRRPRAMELLDLVGIAELAGRLPSTLSGGQQQRAAIARALVNDPPLLLLDEPTGSIDSEATEEVLGILSGLHKSGRTLILVTHDRDVAARAARQITLKDGVVLTDLAAAA